MTDNSLPGKQELNAAMQPVVSELSEHFGATFFVWRQCLDESQWESVAGDDSPEQFDDTLLSQAEFFIQLKQSAAEHRVSAGSHHDRCLVLLPCTKLVPHKLKTVHVVAAGWVPLADEETLQRQADLMLRLLEERQLNQKLQTLNERYANQVSHDFEELYWLRDLASNIACWGVDSHLSEVTARVLPSMCDLIKSDSLLFFPVITDDLISTPQPYIAGNTDIDVSVCWQIVEEYQLAALMQPVVCNDDFDNQNVDMGSIPFSFALVPVTKDSFHAGWLLACKKRMCRIGQYQREAHAISESSLGTFEVGLLEATGTLLANHARNSHLYKEQEDLIIGVVRSLINTVDAKDSYTCGHSERVALMAKRLARQLRMSDEECERIYMTGLLHDVGKIGIPDEVLGKPGKLTDAEFEIIKKHPEIGYAIMRHLKPLEYVLPGILHHHESYDGTGYPMQLKGEEIPLDGRILAVVDAYDAMTSSRPYRTAMPPEKAESILMENAGIQWDAKIVKCFFAALKDMHEICKRTKDETRNLFNWDPLQNSKQKYDSISSAIFKTHVE